MEETSSRQIVNQLLIVFFSKYKKYVYFGNQTNFGKYKTWVVFYSINWSLLLVGKNYSKNQQEKNIKN